MNMQGLYTALITPFDEENQLDEEGLRILLKKQVQAGVEGVVLLGTTGETPTLSESEQKRIIEIGVEELSGKVSVIVGTGSYSTERTIADTRRAEQLGADAALIVTPYYNKPTQEGIYQHFKAIVEATNLPIIVYNVQGRTGQNIATSTLKRIAQLPRIIGVKEASGNVIQMMDVMAAICNEHPHFRVVSGDDALTLPLMALGGDGIISVVSNLFPEQVKALVEAAAAGDFEKARVLHYQLLPLFHAAFIETNPIPIKAAMRFYGLPAGKCRLPLCDLSAENQERLHEVLTSSQILARSVYSASS